MTNKIRPVLIKKNGTITSGNSTKIENAPETSPDLHVGSSDAFMETENTASVDADNMSDEKLDELLDGD